MISVLINERNIFVFKKLWNLMSLMVIVCGLSHAGEVEINVGRLRGVHTIYALNINNFLETAPDICKCDY